MRISAIPNKHVYLAAAIGFCVPIFWGVLSFVLFNAPQSRWADAYWDAVYVTCPPWLLPESAASWVLTPVANAIIYGAVAWCVMFLLRFSASRGHRQ